MHDPYGWQDVRRGAPRVGVDAMCWEVGDGGERSAVLIDVSPDGVRIERPWGLARRRIQLELEMPGTDDVVWLAGEVRFERPRGLLVQTGVKVVAAAARDLRRLRDYVLDRRRALAFLAPAAPAAFDLAAAACYARG